MRSRPLDPRDAKRRIPVAKPHFDQEEERLLLEVVRSGWVTQGPRVAEFERAFAEAVGATEAVAVTSATTALFLSLHALGVGRGDEVIVPSLSFIASANAIAHTGATPVFAEIDPRSYNLDPGAAAAAVTERTRAVMVVHQLGMPAALDPFEALAQSRGLHLIEDAACAVGALYRGQPVGSSGRPCCFSFHPRKVLVTGEGGMITLGDRELAARLRRIRQHGMSVSDLERSRSDRVMIESYPEIGYNFRMSDLQAALGLAQLGKLERFVEKRRTLAARYDQAFADLDRVETPFVPDGAVPNYQSYIVRLRDASRAKRQAMLDVLQRRGVGARRGLMASHLEPCYRGARGSGNLALTEEADSQTLIRPIYHDLGEEDQDHVIRQFLASLEEVFGRPDGRRAAYGTQP